MSPIAKRIFTPLLLCISAGTALGVLIGGRAFPVIEEALGQPLSGLVLGVAGAAMGLLLYELAFSRPPDRPTG